MLNINRIKTYRRGLKVERLHTVPHITGYCNGSHSSNAALIAYDLCEQNNVKSESIVHYMLLHDVAEGYTGDIPANVKMENPELKAQLEQVERKWEEQHLPHMPDLSVSEKAIAKVADLAELGMYCLEEMSLGNKNITFVLVNVVDYMQLYTDIKGCSDFINHFVSRGELNVNPYR